MHLRCWETSGGRLLPINPTRFGPLGLNIRTFWPHAAVPLTNPKYATYCDDDDDILEHNFENK